MSYTTYELKGGRRREERRTHRGNKGNEKFKELTRLDEEWKAARRARVLNQA